MPLPSSGQMTMNAVKAEFSSSQSANLSLKGFGAALGTPVTSNIALAASFYGQSSGVSVTAWTFASNGGSTWSEVEVACGAIGDGEFTQVTLYHDGTGTFPDDDDVVYTNDPGTTKAGQGIYAFRTGKAAVTFVISSTTNGVVSEVAQCEE